MSYYRAALAAAGAGDLTAADRLVRISIALGEDAPSAMRLLDLLRQNGRLTESDESLKSLRELTESGQYKKALKIRFADTPNGHTARGLLYAGLGRFAKARNEFAAALAQDKGYGPAWRAFRACEEKSGGRVYEFIRTAWRR